MRRCVINASVSLYRRVFVSWVRNSSQYSMFPFGAFTDAWPSGRFGDDPFNAHYSDDEDHYRNGARGRQQRVRQGHRQPIKTCVDPRHQPVSQGQPHGPSHQRPVRSAPSSPYSGGGRAAGAAFNQHCDPYAHQQQQHHPQPEAAFNQQQQQQQQPRSPTPSASAAAAARAAPAQLSPAAAATRVQTAWRRHRLSQHRPALKELAGAASKLRQLTEQLHSVQQQQLGMPLTQKQYLELSEPVMKVLFALDAVSPGVPELRLKRKALTQRANQLLDAIQAAHKAQPTAAPAAAPSANQQAAEVLPAAQAQQHKQQKQKKHGMAWFRR